MCLTPFPLSRQPLPGCPKVLRFSEFWIFKDFYYRER